MELKSLIDHPGKLPTVPQVAQRVIASFNAEDVSIAEIAELIAADPVLSAKLLRLANSSYFQFARSIETVEDAIRILGLAMVRHLVLAGGLMGTFVKVPGIDLHQFWTYSLYSACTARWLADRIQVNRDLPFTLGLMHGIGQLQMHHAAPAAAAALDQQVHVLGAGRVAVETQALGFHFLQVSAALARLWNFPASLVEPLECVADPLSAAPFSTMAAIVHLSAWHARNTVLATPAAQARALYPEAVALRLGLSARWVFADAPPAQEENLPTIPALHELTHGLDEILG